MFNSVLIIKASVDLYVRLHKILSCTHFALSYLLFLANHDIEAGHVDLFLLLNELRPPLSPVDVAIHSIYFGGPPSIRVAGRSHE